MDYRALFAKRHTETPQSAPLDGMVANSAGGYAFPVDDWTRLDRFLILGAEGGTYYIGAKTLTRENAQGVERCLQVDGPRVVKTIVEVSQGGRAPKNDPALFVLAMCAGLGDETTRKAALAALPRVARTGTHLFHFVHFVEGFRGWGRALRRGIADWYLAMETERLSLQLVKYKQRDGWSHRDLLRLAHPKTEDAARRALFAWTVQPDNAERIKEAAEKFRLIDGMVQLQVAAPDEAPALVRQYSLPREVVPTGLLNDTAMWDALLADMPMHALVRNLAKMSAIDFLTTGSEVAAYVAGAIRNQEAVRKSRLHPLSILMAQKTYASGKGLRGSLMWTAVPSVIDALDDAFYLGFRNAAPTGKRIMLALDVSASMRTPIAGTAIMASEAAAALALVTAATEGHAHIVAFAADGTWSPAAHYKTGAPKAFQGRETGIKPLPISAKQRLDDLQRLIAGQTFGATDCALPMLYALDKGLKIDAFVIYTDSETWFGDIHPVEALRAYRARTGIQARLIVVGLTSNGFSIADPEDAGMLDVAGFDTAVPAVISDFIRGAPAQAPPAEEE